MVVIVEKEVITNEHSVSANTHLWLSPENALPEPHWHTPTEQECLASPANVSVVAITEWSNTNHPSQRAAEMPLTARTAALSEPPREHLCLLLRYSTA
jgi:hypothetical protein